MAKNSCRKKPKFSEILGTKVVQFWCYTKLVKTKNVPLNWYSSTNFFFQKDSDDFWHWKLALKIRFWHFLTAIFGHLTSLMKKSNPFLWSVQSYVQSEMFLSNSIDMMKNLRWVFYLAFVHKAKWVQLNGKTLQVLKMSLDYPGLQQKSKCA